MALLCAALDRPALAAYLLDRAQAAEDEAVEAS